jgi:DNA processing protein
MEKMETFGVKAFTCNQPDYPARLKEIYDYPPVLYVRGALTAADEWAVAMVGTRRATPYGRQIAEQFAGDLARNQVTVVSGLARGIDAVASNGQRSGGRTIAALGGLTWSTRLST